MIKKNISIIVALIMIMESVCANFSISNKVEADVLPFEIVDSSYAILDDNVISKKIKLIGNDVQFIDYSNAPRHSTITATNFVEKKSENGYIYYFVGIKGLIKKYITTKKWRPEVSKIKCGINSKDIIVSINSPESNKYDIYNYSKNKYIELQADAIKSFTDDSLREFCEYEKNGKYGLLDNNGEILFEANYDTIKSYYDEKTNINYAIGYKWEEDKQELLCADGTMVKMDGIRETLNSMVLCEKSDEYFVLSTKDGKVLARYSREDFVTYTKAMENGKEYIAVNYKYGEPFQCVDTRIMGLKDGKLTVTLVKKERRSTIDIISTDSFVSLNSKYDCSCMSLYKNERIGSSIEVSKNYIFSCSVGDFVKDYYEACYINLRGEEITNETSCSDFENIKTIYGNKKRYFLKYSNTGGYNLENSEGKIIKKNIDKEEIYVKDEFICELKYDGIWVYDTKNDKCVYESDKNIGIADINDNFSIKGDVILIYDKENENYGYIDTTTNKVIEPSLKLGEGGVTVKEILGANDNEIYVFEDDDDSVFIVKDDVIIAQGSILAWTYDKNNSLVVEYDGEIDDRIYKHFKEDDKWYFSSNDQRKIEIYNANFSKLCSFLSPEHVDWSEGTTSIQNGNTYLYLKHIGNQGYGIVDSSAKEIIEPIYDEIIPCSENFAYITNDGSSAIVDDKGKALIYGEFDEDLCDNEYGMYHCIYGGFAICKDENCYLYDFTKCNGSEMETEKQIDENMLFGEYSSYLDNSYYESISNNIIDDIGNTISSYSKYDLLMSKTKSVLLGQGKYLVKQVINSLPGRSLSEKQVNQELALSYLENIDTKYVVENFNSWISGSKKANKYISKITAVQKEIQSLETEKDKLAFSRIMADENISQGTIYNSAVNACKNISKFVKLGGDATSIVDYLTTYFIICEMENDVVVKLMELIPDDSALYDGLSYINLKQTYNGGIIYSFEVINDETLGLIVDAAENSLYKFLDSKYTGLIAAAIKGLSYIVGENMSVSKFEDVDKASLAMINACVLKRSVKEYQKTISNNYAYSQGISIDTLKENYSILVSTYFNSLLIGLDCASQIDMRGNSELLAMKKNKFMYQLLYRSYIKSCLNNAKMKWKYDVSANNKIIIDIIKSAEISASGRIRYTDVIEIKKDDSDISGKIVCIPSEVDGLSVDSVKMNGLENRYQGIYIPSSVSSVSGNENDIDKNTVIVYSNDSLKDELEQLGGEVFKIDKKASQIEIASQPSTLDVDINKEIDLSKIRLKVTYDDGSSEIIDKGFYITIENPKVGACNAKLKFEDLSLDYEVNIINSDIEYIVYYQDANGNEILEPTRGVAKVGQNVEVEVPYIEGYKNTDKKCQFTIGQSNEFVIKYEGNDNSLKEANVKIADIKLDKSNYSNFKLNCVVSINDKELVYGKDYKIIFDYKNWNLGKNDLAILGVGDYSGFIGDYVNITESEHVWSNLEIIKASTEQMGIKYRECFICSEYDEIDTMQRINDVYLSKISYVYDGNRKNPAVTVKDLDNEIISKTNYSVKYYNNTNAGSGRVVVTFKGDYEGRIQKTFRIDKSNQNISVGKIKKIKKSTLSKKKVSFYLKTKAKGRISYKILGYPKGMKKYISISNRGKVTLKKKAKKGVYKVKIIASQTQNYNSMTKVVKIKIK